MPKNASRTKRHMRRHPVRCITHWTVVAKHSESTTIWMMVNSAQPAEFDKPSMCATNKHAFTHRVKANGW